PTTGLPTSRHERHAWRSLVIIALHAKARRKKRYNRAELKGNGFPFRLDRGYHAAMNREYFQSLLEAQPFQPFAIQLISDVVHTVRRPEQTLLTRTMIAICDAEMDSIVVCSLVHIAKVVILPEGGSGS